MHHSDTIRRHTMSEQKRKAVDEDAPDGITADGERLDKRAKSSSKFLSTMKPFLEELQPPPGNGRLCLKCNKRGHLAKSHCADCDQIKGHTDTCKFYVRPGDIHLYGDLAIIDWWFITVTLSNTDTPKSWLMRLTPSCGTWVAVPGSAANGLLLHPRLARARIKGTCTWLRR